MIDVNDVLVAERREFVDLLGELAAQEWARETECPAWDVKGIALHVLGDDLSLLSRQRDVAVQGLVVYAETHPGLGFRELLDGFNEQWVAAASFLSTEMVIELLVQSGDWTSAFYRDIEPDLLGEPVLLFGSADPAPYWQIAAREYVERWVHHHQIRRALGRPELGDEFLDPAARVITVAFAANLPDLAAAPGTVIASTIGDRMTQRLVRADGAWIVEDGPGDADATLTIDPGLATALLSRGLPAAEVEEAVTVSGDEALGTLARGAMAALASGT